MQTEKQSNNISAVTLVSRANKTKKDAVKLQAGIDMDTLISAYLEVAGSKWSLTTQRSEASRLRALLPVLTAYSFNAEAIYAELNKTLEPYSIKTAFIRLSALFDFAKSVDVVVTAENPFRNYMAKSSTFKKSSVYLPAKVEMTFEEVTAALASDTSVEAETAKYLLKTGLRISELYKVETVDGQLVVKGKGGKLRQVLSERPAVLCSPTKLRQFLTKFNITPHDLRKLTATKLASEGIDLNTLKDVFGWSSINTAQIYLQNNVNEKTKNKIRELLNPTKG